MASKNLLNLLPITPELKSITPYLQRAEEVKAQEPIVAYWCAYYAAQIGIGLKARDSPSRELLLALLGTLERLKNEIGPNDAVDVDAAGAAYLENFALRIFTLADNEDREGRATRATAKKFLAAANFLEVLKTFPKTDISESVGEKVRYAKWKAAEIAKAFREGRKPAPGPPGWEESQIDVLAASPKASMGRITPPRSPRKNGHPLPSSSSAPDSLLSLSADEGNWSTIAVPGTDPDISLNPVDDVVITSSPAGQHKRSNSGGSSRGSTGRCSPTRRATVREEMEGPHTRTPSPAIAPTKPRSPYRSSGSKPPSPSPPRSRNNSPGHEKKVHFTPSVVGGSLSSGSSSASTQRQAPPPPPPPHQVYSQPSNIAPRYAPTPVPEPVALTPAVITKAQKHCRFAASALDYEDIETAKKELRAALAMLGG